MQKWMTALLLMMSSIAAWAQNAPQAPALPENVAKLEHDQLTQAINLLSKSEFTEAEKLLKPLVVPATVQ